MFNFENARILGYSHKSEFLGDILEYRRTKSISVQGSLYALDNSEGVTEIWSGMAEFVSEANDYDEILINGVSFGFGKVNSISFEESNDVRVKNYNVSLTVFDSGNLFNTTGLSQFSGIDFDLFDRVTNLSESFSFSIPESNIPSYNHSVSIHVSSGHDGLNPIDVAKYIAQDLMASCNLTGILGGFSQISGAKKYHKESYNLITNDCSFEETVELVSSPISQTYSHSISTDQDGITRVSEQGSIRGTQESVKEYSFQGYSGTTDAVVFNRCQEAFNTYAPTGSYSLHNVPATKKASIKTQEGVIDYSFQFDNDPRRTTNYLWEYVEKIERPELGDFVVTEDGTIKGLGNTREARFANAQSAFGPVWNASTLRLGTLYSGYGSEPLYEINKTVSQSAFQGTIQYSRTFSDGTSLINSNGIKKKVINITDDPPVPITSKIGVLNEKEVVQSTSIASLGKRSVEIALSGARRLGMNDFLTAAKTYASEYIPNDLGSDVYLENASYQWSKAQGSFSLSVSWIYHNDKAFEDTTLT